MMFFFISAIILHSISLPYFLGIINSAKNIAAQRYGTTTMFAKYFAPLLAVALIASPAMAADPDYSGLKKAISDFTTALDTLETRLPKIDNAHNTAQTFDDIANVSKEVFDAMTDFARKYPEAARAQQVPPELATEMAGLENAKKKFTVLQNGLGALGRRFASDPEVAAALARFKATFSRQIP